MHRSMIATALAIATVSSTPALSLATEDESDDVTVTRAFSRRRNTPISESLLRNAYRCKAEVKTTEDERMRALAEWVLHQYFAEIDNDG